MDRFSLRQMITLNAYWVGLSVMWNGLHIIILPAVLAHLVPEGQRNTYLGLLTFAGLVIAAVLQPLAGAASDRMGRRKPLILLGTAFDFLFLALLGWAGGFVWVAVGYIGLQFSSNTAHGPMQGLLPDHVQPEHLGAASGFKNLFDMAGLVFASLVLGRLLAPETVRPVTPVGVIMLMLALGAAVTLLGVRERGGRGRPPLRREPARVPFRESLRTSLRDHSGYWWLIASRFAYLLGIYGIQAFAQYYVADVLKAPNPAELTGNLLGTITLALIALAVAGGYLSDRFGRTRILLAANGVTAVGCLLLLFARTPLTLLIFGSVLGCGLGLFLTTNWALANELAPPGEAGMFLGLTNLATAGAGAAGRLEGPLIDLLNNARPGAFYGYAFVFVFGAVCALVSAGLLRKVPRR